MGEGGMIMNECLYLGKKKKKLPHRFALVIYRTWPKRALQRLLDKGLMEPEQLNRRYIKALSEYGMNEM